MSLARTRRSAKVEKTHKVGGQAKATEVADAGLGWLRLELAVDGGDETDVDESKVVVADAELELTHRLDKRSRLTREGKKKTCA